MKKTRILAIIGFLFCSMILGHGLLQQPTHATTAEEEEAVTSVMNQLKTVLQQAVEDYNTSHETEYEAPEIIEDAHGYGTPEYRPDSLNAFLMLNSDKRLYIPAGEVVNEGYTYVNPIGITELRQTLETLGFTTYYDRPFNFQLYQFINNETGVICAFGGQYRVISCGHINWAPQSITNEWKDFINSIGDAYYAEINDFPSIYQGGDIKLSDNTTLPTILDSDYEPYQYTNFAVGGGVVLFYRKSPTSEWVFFRGTQTYIDCNEYTGEAQKGFAGMACWDTATDSMSKVSVPSDSTKAPDTGASTEIAEKTSISMIGCIAAGIAIALVSMPVIRKRLITKK